MLYFSSYLCAAYYDYFAAMTKILCAPCNTNVSGGSHHLLPPAAPQDPMEVLLIQSPLLVVLPPHSHTIRSIRSVCPIQPVASQFLPFYNPAHKSQFLWSNQSKPIRSSCFNSRLNQPIPIQNPVTAFPFVPTLSCPSSPLGLVPDFGGRFCPIFGQENTSSYLGPLSDGSIQIFWMSYTHVLV